MKIFLLGLLVAWSTSSFAENLYECHAGQHTIRDGGSLAGTLMQVNGVKVPADGKLHEFKADKIDTGFIYFYITEFAENDHVAAKAIFVPANKRFTTPPDLSSLTPFFGFEVVGAFNTLTRETKLSASHEQLATIPGERTYNGLPLDVIKLSYLNCFLSNTSVGNENES